MVTPFEVAKCRTRPPSVVSLLGMLGDQSGSELKPPINCQTLSAEAAKSMLADACAIAKSFLLAIDWQGCVWGNAPLLPQFMPEVVRHLPFQRGNVLRDPVWLARARNDCGRCRMREREMQRCGLDWNLVTIRQRFDPSDLRQNFRRRFLILKAIAADEDAGAVGAPNNDGDFELCRFGRKPPQSH